MSWNITVANGKTTVTHNGKPVAARSVQVDLRYDSFPTAKVEFMVSKDDVIALEMVERKPRPVEKTVTLVGVQKGADNE